DRTETLDEFIEIQKFLNSKEMTSMGKGVGLEIGNSFFFYEPPNEAISYFNSGSEVPETIKSFIKAGIIDFLHSYGKKSDFIRKDAIIALKELKTNNCKVDVWVDHTKSIDNFGDDVTFGQGDHPDSVAYHADLTLAYGIKFAWLGRVTMITGQAVPISLETFSNIFDSDHPIYSLINISKEFAKNVLAVFGNKKYAMHKKNDLIRIAELDDGQKIYEFIRFDNYWKGVSTGANSNGLCYVISERTLNRLKKIGGYMIIYTHFGRNSNCSQYICKETQNALRNLAKEFEEGNIYVTTTSKLLNYYITYKYLNWSYESQNGKIKIHIHNIKDPIFGSFVPSVENLNGLTFYLPNMSKTIIYLGNKEITAVKRNPADYTKKESITIIGK
ncbi:MAG: hypothetical protein ACFFDN_22720, partial [Candidatus Hodarchaeota archaeon]